jgi:hypothetical protein
LIFIDADTLISPELLGATINCFQSGKICGGGSLVRFNTTKLGVVANSMLEFWNQHLPAVQPRRRILLILLSRRMGGDLRIRRNNLCRRGAALLSKGPPLGQKERHALYGFDRRAGPYFRPKSGVVTVVGN